MITLSNLDSIAFFSAKSSMSLYCRGRKLIAENLLLIVASTSLMTVFGLKLRTWQSNRRVRLASHSLYQQLKQDLQRQGRGVVGISETDMLDRFRSLSGHNSVARDEQTFSTRIMPTIEGLRKNDRAINTVQKMKFGRPMQVWQLK